MFHVVSLMDCIFLNIHVRFARVCNHIEDLNARNN